MQITMIIHVYHMISARSSMSVIHVYYMILARSSMSVIHVYHMISARSSTSVIHVYYMISARSSTSVSPISIQNSLFAAGATSINFRMLAFFASGIPLDYSSLIQDFSQVIKVCLPNIHP